MTVETTGGSRLTLNKSGYWVLTWAEKGSDGKWRSRSQSLHTKDAGVAGRMRDEYARTKRALEAADAEIEAQAARSTVGDLLRGYLDGMGVCHASHRRIVRRVIKAVGEYLPEELDARVLGAWRQSRAGVLQTSFNRELAALRAGLGWCVKNKKLAKEKLPEIDVKAAPTVNVRSYLEEADEGRLWNAALGDVDEKGRLTRIARFVLVGLGTGVRPGAVRELEWARVRLDLGVIDFRVPGERVTRKRKVNVPISVRLRPVLERMQREHVERLSEGVTDLRYRTHVCWIPETRLADHSRPFFEKAGVGWVTPHWLRHTFISLGLQAGITVWDMAGLVGASVGMIESVYGHHAVNERAREAANKRWAA